MSSMKSYAVGLVALIAVAGTGYYLMNKQTPSAEDAAATAAAIPVATVTYQDGTGFSPRTIQTRVGGVVRFVNQSMGQMWVASDPNPSRTNYPAFDQSGGIKTGDKYTEKSKTYEIIFDKVGTYGYHDQLHPLYTGNVTVTE